MIFNRDVKAHLISLDILFVLNSVSIMEKLFALRGATSAENCADSIIESTAELYKTILRLNSLTETQLVSVQISVTSDLTAVNPATALRKKNLAMEVPLFCVQEPAYENSVPHIIRFLVYFYAEQTAKPKSVYLKNAENLKSKMLKSFPSDTIKFCQSNGGTKKKLWLVAREYAGIAEAGGLKNVVKALAENSCDAGIAVTVFLPKYSFVQLDAKKTETVKITVNEKTCTINFFETLRDGIHFVFVDTEFFAGKQSIYTYTEEEAKTHATKKGTAYSDTDEMNISFQLGVLHYAEFLSSDEAPDVVHCHDGHTALLPAFAKNACESLVLFFKATKFFVTIHNAGDYYRQELCNLEYAKKMTGLSNQVLLEGLCKNRVEPFLVSSKYATLTTVSPWYAEELHDVNLSPFSKNFSQALIDKKISIIGITNGIDYDSYNPAQPSVSFLPFSYAPLQSDFAGKYQSRDFFLQMLKVKEQETLSGNYSLSQNVKCFGSFTESDERLFYFAYHGRIVHQKGIDILLQVIERICRKYANCRFLIMGQGTPEYEMQCEKIAESFFGQVIYFKGYDKRISRMVTAAADFILLPSLFEPCGLEDFIAQLYATIPIAHAIGGLKKIENNKTGFLFSASSPFGNMQNRFSKDGMSDALENLIVKIIEMLKIKNEDVLENETMREIILCANKNIVANYNWKKIIREQYFPIYGF